MNSTRVFFRRAAKLTAGVVVAAPIAKVWVATRPLRNFDDDASSSTTSSWSSLPPTRYITNTASSSSSSSSDDLSWKLWLLSEASNRLIRDVYTVVLIINEYVKVMRECEAIEKDQNHHQQRAVRIKALWEKAHDASAEHLLKLCKVNRGIYIKLAQHVAQLEHMIPEAYVRTLAVMTHAAPQDSFQQVQDVFQQEFQGRSLQDIFEDVDPLPIASASLAQVHVGYLRETTNSSSSSASPSASAPSTTASRRRKVAIKVQHQGLKETSRADIATVVFLVHAVKSLFPKFNYEWLADEVQRNLPCELNFTLEAENAERSRRNFAHQPQVLIPTVFHSYTTPRVLTMSFEEGVYANKLQEIKEMGLEPADVARLISEAFSEQIFTHSFVHCDPHAGNLLVRRMPAKKQQQQEEDDKGEKESPKNGGRDKGWFFSRLWKGRFHKQKRPQPQLVLLDHGLYREIPAHIRYSYAILWRSIVMGDEAGIIRACDRLHISGSSKSAAPVSTATATASSTSPPRLEVIDYHRLFVSMLTTKSWDKLTEVTSSNNLDALRTRGTTAERNETSGHVKEYADEIQFILRSLPRELLLILKTNDCLRTVDFALGTPVNNFIITARYAQQAVNKERYLESPGFLTRVFVGLDTLKMEMKLRSFQYSFAMLQAWQALIGEGGAAISGSTARGESQQKSGLEMR